MLLPTWRLIKCSSQPGPYIFTQAKRLLHLSIRLGIKTPPNILSLISDSIEFLQILVEIEDEENMIGVHDVKYLRLLSDIGDVLRSSASALEKGAYIQSLDHGGSERSNAAIGFALASLPPSWMVSAGQPEPSAVLEWRPLSPTAPSTMELLGQAELLGAVSLTKIPGIQWEALALETKVQIGFSEAKKKAFVNAADILEQTLSEVGNQCGAISLELLLVGTVLINCWNTMGREEDGESLGRYIWASIFNAFNTTANIETPHQIYLAIAMADSFLGQGKYDEAKQLLASVLNYQQVDDNIAVSATLRLLKVNRRLRDRESLSEGWSRLEKAIKRFNEISDTLKYECIEETLCGLALLEAKDIPELPQVSQVVKTLSRYRVDTYHGTPTATLNLSQNLEELKRFKTKLNLFSLSGPELHFARKTRERFPSATLTIIEKVASVNWMRLKRIEGMREMAPENDQETKPTVKSIFEDSALGSSIGSDPMVVDSAPEAQWKAQSIFSISSFMSFNGDATVLPPIPTENSSGERNCFICEKPINNVKNESQWR